MTGSQSRPTGRRTTPERRSSSRSGFALTLAAAFVAAASFATASSAFADDLRVPQDYRTLQAAVDAAEPGDRILVRGSVRGYTEVRTPGVTIVAKRGASIRADIDVSAEDVTIQGFKVKAGQIRVWGDGATVSGNQFRGASFDAECDELVFQDNTIDHPQAMVAVGIRGDDATITGNDLSYGMCGFVLSGDRVTFSDNTVDATDEAGVVLIGDEAVVTDNEVEDVWQVDGIAVQGDDSVIEHNTVTESAGGIRCEGSGCTVGGNTIDVGTDGSRISSDTGLPLTGCPGITVTSWGDVVVEDNVVEVTSGGGIHVEGDGVVVTENTVTGEQAVNGIQVEGDRNVVSGNVVVMDGTPAPTFDWWGEATPSDGIDVRGTQNAIEGNDVSGNADESAAIRVGGNSNTVDANAVHDTVGDGIVVEGRYNQITTNVADGVGADGFIVDGYKNTVQDSDVLSAGGCGLLVYGNADVLDCGVGDCAMGGLVNLATATDVYGTTALTNDPVDLINLGSIDEDSGNTFGTSSTDRNRFRDLDDLRRSGFSQPATPTWNFPSGLTFFGW